MINVNKLAKKINQWGASHTPFLLMVDFEMNESLALPLSEIDSEHIGFDFNGQTNVSKQDNTLNIEPYWKPTFVEDFHYKAAFDRVQQGLNRGDSFLTNLTFSTTIETNWSLENIFKQSKAPYRLYWKDRFTVFSPDAFVQIKDGRIFSFPMKGTLAAHFPKDILINNAKEKAEHATIVDLIRNDLSIVSKDVRVDQYRYVERLNTNQGDLWQTSSKISGQLPMDFHKTLGDILLKLLPAGSISGAPKSKTVSLIQQAEIEKRGFYTGVAFLWDGYQLDSCVLIRFVEKTQKGMKYWSGGGITAYSNWEEEYKELKEKVYLPIEDKIACEL